MIDASVARALMEEATQTRFPLLKKLTESIVHMCWGQGDKISFPINSEWKEHAETIKQVFEDYNYHVSYGTVKGKPHLIVSW